MKKTKFNPLAFRFRPEERAALRALAKRWGVSQVAVLRRLLAEATAKEGSRQ